MAKAIASGSATTPTMTPDTRLGNQCSRRNRPALQASSSAIMQGRCKTCGGYDISMSSQTTILHPSFPVPGLHHHRLRRIIVPSARRALFMALCVSRVALFGTRLSAAAALSYSRCSVERCPHSDLPLLSFLTDFIIHCYRRRHRPRQLDEGEFRMPLLH